MITRSKLLSLVIAPFLVALTSCVHRTFEYDSGQTAWLDVEFDWCNEPDANPASMSLYMFPADGGEPLRYEFVGCEGGTIRVAPDIYHAICINSDSRDIFYRNIYSHNTFDVTTAESTSLNFGTAAGGLLHTMRIPRATGTENQLLVNQPPLLWSQSVTSFEVTVSPKADNRQSNQVLTMRPERIVDIYKVTVKKIINVQSISALSATISDMSDGYLAGQHMPNEIPATITMELVHNKDKATACGSFLTFGHCPVNRRPHKLMLLALLNDGSQCHFEFDVSNQAHDAPDADNVHHIMVECIELPMVVGGSGGGFTPSVDEWQNVDIGLEM
ncbi:MAG: DUF5119 domain-containing protein [Bacteroidales bacterium]|nr:DUF5119 domain-containing protein [Bacteroidales bacterium]